MIYYCRLNVIPRMVRDVISESNVVLKTSQTLGIKTQCQSIIVQFILAIFHRHNGAMLIGNQLYLLWKPYFI